MAEFVELRLEEMLPELEQMQRVQLFTAEEIKAVIKKRREFEYKLQKRTKNKEDYLKYIQYEITLLSLLRLRREKIGYQHKKPEIDYAIAHRINKLFTYATARFTSDVKLWLSHIEFCKRMNWKSSISRVFVHLLAVKGNDPSLWILAAKWEFEENHSVSNARSLLLRALRFHPNNMQVYTEAFRLELLEADRLRKRRAVLGLSCEADLPDQQEKRDEILDGKLAVLFYEDSKKVVKSASELVPFLTVSKDFDFTREIQKSIFEYMKAHYNKDEMTWDTIARDQLEKNSITSDGTALKLKERIELCTATYEEAIKSLDTPKMWQLYVETLLELHGNEAVRSKVEQKLNFVCQQAMEEKKLNESHLLDWVTILEKYCMESRKSVLEEALRQFPKNATLWLKYLKSLSVEEPLFAIDVGGVNIPAEAAHKNSVPEELLPQFWNAIKVIGHAAEAIPLWETVIERYLEASKEDGDLLKTVEDLYRKSLQQEPPISNHFKPQILSWIATSKGLEESRRFYQEQANLPPLVIDFHYKMIELELNANVVDPQQVRKAFEGACQHFGREDPEIWLRYIRFELDHASADANRVGDLHYRAKLSLDSVLADQFLTQYTLLHLGTS